MKARKKVLKVVDTDTARHLMALHQPRLLRSVLREGLVAQDAEKWVASDTARRQFQLSRSLVLKLLRTSPIPSRSIGGLIYWRTADLEQLKQ